MKTIKTKNENLNNTIKSSTYLMLTAFIWGFAFVAQRAGMEYVGPFFFSGVRMLMGTATLMLFYFISQKSNPFKIEKYTLKAGIAAGLVLFFAANLQQIGLIYTSAGKSGFLTTLYIVIVPILGIFLKQKTHWNTWVSVLIATVGLYFLCVTEALTITPGDTVVLISSLFWALHILTIGHFASNVDILKMSYVQFFVVGILSIVLFPFLDSYFTDIQDLSAVADAVPTLLYSGILSTGIAFSLQALGQKFANPTTASLILSLEAVFSLIGGVLILSESFSPREIFGCVLMFAAVILAQLPVKSKARI